MSLLKFFFTEKCTNCGERIEKAAQYCRHCGAGRANSWRKCNTCGVSVAADSQFCWSCKANVAVQPRDEIFSDRWRRSPGIFATRITIDTPQDRLRNGIQVDEGTLGALYSNGVLKTELQPGYHSQTSFWERLTGGGKSGGFTEAIIATTDPVSSFVSLSGTAALFTKDYSPVEAAVLVKVQLADFGVFSRRMLPAGTDTVRDDDLMLSQSSRVAEILRRHLSKLDVAEAARSTDLRHEIEAALGAELPALLEEFGLRFRGVEDVRLDSEQITRVREAEGGLSQTTRELEWAKKKRELEQSHQLAGIKDEFAFKEQLDRWTHEYTLTSIEREHIVTMRRIQLQKEQQIADVRRVGDVQLTEQEYQIEVERREREARLAAFEREHHTKIEAEKRQHEMDMKELDDVRARQLEALERIQRLKLEKMAAETRNKVDLGQGLKDVPSPVIAKGAMPLPQSQQINEPDQDELHFTATAAKSLAPGKSTELVVWAHLWSQHAEVLHRAGMHHGRTDFVIKNKSSILVARNARLCVSLCIPDAEVFPDADEILWTGEIANACFVITVPKDFSGTNLRCAVEIRLDLMVIARLAFVLNIDEKPQEIGSIVANAKPYRSAFASYASEDLPEVLKRIQGMQKLAPFLDVFMDVVRLRSGQDWQNEIIREIDTRDVFYLFWSEAASHSKWVEWEWHHALKQRGIGFIDPVPLISPTVAPPPQELSRIHFNDWVLGMISNQKEASSSN